MKAQRPVAISEPLPSRLKRPPAEALGAKAEGRRHLHRLVRFLRTHRLIKKQSPAQGPVACTNGALPKSAARRGQLPARWPMTGIGNAKWVTPGKGQWQQERVDDGRSLEAAQEQAVAGPLLGTESKPTGAVARYGQIPGTKHLLRSLSARAWAVPRGRHSSRTTRIGRRRSRPSRAAIRGSAGRRAESASAGRTGRRTCDRD
jgi:hypothetical protein